MPTRLYRLGAALSVFGLATAVLAESALWVVVLVTLLPWVPVFSAKMVWVHRHYAWLALFTVLAVTQLGHFLEHVSQIVQIHLLGRTGHHARGVFGALDVEWVHIAWNSWVLVAVVVLVVHFRSNPWLWVTLVVAGWHEVEHVWITITYVSTGVAGTPGLLARGGEVAGGLFLARADLHMLYNLAETVPLVMGLVWVLHRSHDEWLGRVLAGLPGDTLVSVTAHARPTWVKAGEPLVLDPGKLYLVVHGDVELTMPDDSSPAPLQTRVVGAGEVLGAAWPSGVAGVCARARSDVELLAVAEEAVGGAARGVADEFDGVGGDQQLALDRGEQVHDPLRQLARKADQGDPVDLPHPPRGGRLRRPAADPGGVPPGDAAVDAGDGLAGRVRHGRRGGRRSRRGRPAARRGGGPAEREPGEVAGNVDVLLAVLACSLMMVGALGTFVWYALRVGATRPATPRRQGLCGPRSPSRPVVEAGGGHEHDLSRTTCRRAATPALLAAGGPSPPWALDRRQAPWSAASGPLHDVVGSWSALGVAEQLVTSPASR